MTDTNQPPAVPSKPVASKPATNAATNPATKLTAKSMPLWGVYGGLIAGIAVVLIVVGLLVHVGRHSDDTDQVASDPTPAITVPSQVPTKAPTQAPTPIQTQTPVAPASAASSAPSTLAPSTPATPPLAASSDNAASVVPPSSEPETAQPLNQRVATLETKVASLSAAGGDAVSPKDFQALAQNVQTLEKKLDDEQQALQGLRAQATRIAAQNRAEQDVEVLRRSFPAAAASALAASRPERAYHSFWKRILIRVEGLVVVRRGDQVLVGDPAAGLLHQAQTCLDANDVQGALKALDRLDGPAAVAMQTWMARARAVLAETPVAP